MKKYLLLPIALLLIGVLAAGCGPAAAENGDVVKIDYTLKLEDGTVYDTSDGGDPLEITLGQAMLPAAIEEAVIGMKAGESKILTLTADQAFGQRDDELIIEVAKNELPEGLEPQPGMQLQSTAVDGSTITVSIIDISETTVTLDGNHPLAGENIIFEFKLNEILASVPSGAAPDAFTEAMANGLPTIAEFGSSTCVPCKQMKPVMEELAGEYEGKVNVVIVEVYDYVELARQHKIMGIPTQIFFDATGKEVYRHSGFFAKDNIIEQFKEMGID